MLCPKKFVSKENWFQKIVGQKNLGVAKKACT